MIHFGLSKLEFKVKFDKSCYYPFTFSEERKHTKILFGACFGLWWYNNSISLSFRPSENKLDKMDLFRYIFSDEFEENKYIGSLDIEREYTIRLIFERYNNVYRIQVFSDMENEPVINFCKQYKYPVFPFGYIIKRTYGKILLERK